MGPGKVREGEAHLWARWGAGWGTGNPQAAGTGSMEGKASGRRSQRSSIMSSSSSMTGRCSAFMPIIRSSMQGPEAPLAGTVGVSSRFSCRHGHTTG